MTMISNGQTEVKIFLRQLNETLTERYGADNERTLVVRRMLDLPVAPAGGVPPRKGNSSLFFRPTNELS